MNFNLQQTDSRLLLLVHHFLASMICSSYKHLFTLEGGTTPPPLHTLFLITHIITHTHYPYQPTSQKDKFIVEQKLLYVEHDSKTITYTSQKKHDIKQFEA